MERAEELANPPRFNDGGVMRRDNRCQRAANVLGRIACRATGCDGISEDLSAPLLRAIGSLVFAMKTLSNGIRQVGIRGPTAGPESNDTWPVPGRALPGTSRRFGREDLAQPWRRPGR
jgi:hypothetical protein